MRLDSLRRPFAAVLAATALILLLPLTAMQFTDEVAWGPGDFVVAGVLLLGAGTAWILATRRVRTPAQRFAVTALVLLVLVATWSELAIGWLR